MVNLIHGDCREQIKNIADSSIDLVLTDPPYPEISRDYGRLTESKWHDLMNEIIPEIRRVLKPTGSSIFILQPNSSRHGSMRLWLWEFLLKWSKEWNLVQDVYWWNHTALAYANKGLLRPSVKYCLWFGEPDCYRKQDNVLWDESQESIKVRTSGRFERSKTKGPSGHPINPKRSTAKAAERGGVTPFNLIPFGNTNPKTSAGSFGHGAGTPYKLVDWWIRYLCPDKGCVLDPFMGSGTMGLASLNYGADFIGIEKEKKYFEISARRITELPDRNE